MTKPRPIVLAIIAMILALAGATAVYAVPHATRNASAGPTVSLAVGYKGCAVVHVALHGTGAPTITCLSSTGPANPARHTGSITATLDTSEGCGGGYNLFIDSANYPYAYCFSGSGYLGFAITNILEMKAGNNSWVRLYFNGAGTFFNLAGGWNEEWFEDGSSAQNVGITQVCDACGYHS